MNRKFLAIVAVILVFSGIYTYTHLKVILSNKKDAVSKEIPVSAGLVEQQNITVPLKSIGNVQAYSTVSVKSLVDGELINVNFNEGDFVKKGQMLFLIDPRSFENQLHQAEANLAHDQAMYENASLQLKRNSLLLNKNYISRQDFDQLNANEKAYKALVQADQAGLENAKLQLSYASINSPIDGRTGSLQINPGNIIKTANGNTLVSISQIQPIYVAFSVPQQYLPKLQIQLTKHPINVIAEVEGYKETGQLTFIDNSIDTTTGTILLKATFNNQQQRLWPGQFVNISLPSAEFNNALLVPSTAVQVGQNGPYVYAIKSDHTVIYQPVKLGPILNKKTVILHGLQNNQQVVTAGQLRLTDGASVKIGG